MKNIIYCFSDTGNGLYIAKRVAKMLGNTEVHPVMKLQDDPEIPEGYTKVGFMVPTCFAHPPKVVTQILEKIQLPEHQKMFIMVTYGGGDIYTIYDLRRQLSAKTDQPVQCFGIQMPGNHLVGFGAWPETYQRYLFKKADRKIIRIVEDIKNDRPTKAKKPLPKQPTTFIQKTFNGWLGVKVLDTCHLDYYVTDRCVHCGICEKLCPVGNITVKPDGVSFGNHCQQCMACIQWCPEHAIAHPNVPADRKRYHNPDIKIRDMLELNNITK